MLLSCHNLIFSFKSIDWIFDEWYKYLEGLLKKIDPILHENVVFPNVIKERMEFITSLIGFWKGWILFWNIQFSDARDIL